MILTILVDDKNSWFIPYANKLVSILQKDHDVKLIHDYKELRGGDCAFLLSCNKIVPKEFLKLNKHNIVVHPSALPKGKGFSPLTWQILEGKNRIPITLFEAVEDVDAGDIYFQDVTEFEGHELNEELKQKQGEKTLKLILKFLDSYNNLKGIKQKGESSFYPRRRPEDSEIDIDKTIRELFNKFRVADNDRYPLFFKHKGHRYILKIYKDKK